MTSTGSAASAGRRITVAAVRRQNAESAETSCLRRTTRSESIRSPSTVSRAGSTTTAPTAAVRTTAIAARPTDRRK
jgi:hypothetical protein